MSTTEQIIQETKILNDALKATCYVIAGKNVILIEHPDKNTNIDEQPHLIVENIPQGVSNYMISYGQIDLESHPKKIVKAIPLPCNTLERALYAVGWSV